ncbi:MULTISPECIES: DUF6779 domain-containing protein [Thermocrispum]|uniref:DUF6779 domain-containing protein n=1 Tax=Thermocrispum agreste TaxID=37925 RepID=A0A2W4JJ44_9PSEU|nr:MULTISPECIES: DUF6779 domain-containing protein [Thermocrispum]PZM98491.1 MAG: hypothetical protein DIU77_07820 [Thermocrispum agreste]
MHQDGHRSSPAWLVAGAIFAVVATVLLVLSDDARWLRLGIVAALWAAFLGGFLATHYRRQADRAVESLEDAQAMYELELEREVAARREYELQVEADAKVAAEETTRKELDALRNELATLRETLQRLMNGEVLYERVALTAQSTRMRSLRSEPKPKTIDAPSNRTDGPQRQLRSALADQRTELLPPVVDTAQERDGSAGADQSVRPGPRRGANRPVDGPPSFPDGQRGPGARDHDRAGGPRREGAARPDAGRGRPAEPAPPRIREDDFARRGRPERRGDGRPPGHPGEKPVHAAARSPEPAQVRPAPPNRDRHAGFPNSRDEGREPPWLGRRGAGAEPPAGRPEQQRRPDPGEERGRAPKEDVPPWLAGSEPSRPVRPQGGDVPHRRGRDADEARAPRGRHGADGDDVRDESIFDEKTHITLNPTLPPAVRENLRPGGRRRKEEPEPGSPEVGTTGSRRDRDDEPERPWLHSVESQSAQREEEDEAYGSHSSGRSVSELLAAYGSSVPRRRRRRD